VVVSSTVVSWFFLICFGGWAVFLMCFFMVGQFFLQCCGVCLCF
jgi:hypothetical protein